MARVVPSGVTASAPLRRPSAAHFPTRTVRGMILLTTEEVASLIRIPVGTLRYWRHSGFGPPSFRLGRRVVYRRGAVVDWVEHQERIQSGG